MAGGQDAMAPPGQSNFETAGRGPRRQGGIAISLGPGDNRLMRIPLGLAFALGAAAAASAQPAPEDPDQAAAARMLEHVRVLSSDEFEGRAPGTAGEDLSVNYIRQEFSRLGLLPGNPDGTYVQEVPMVGIVS